jgi:hypothetical protein
MKKMVWVLILINIGLLVYFNKDVILPSAPKAAMLAIHPEKISVLTQQQIDALPKKVNPATSAAATETVAEAVPTTTPNTSVASTACYEWGVFSTTKLVNAQSLVSSLSLQATTKEQSSMEAKRFWIYKPPLKSIEAAQAKALELKALGIKEIYVVQDAKWKNAISFGVFEDERLATNLLNELKGKGVKDVVKAPRNQDIGHVSLEFSNLTEEQVNELKKLKSNFPEAEIKEVACN